MRELSITVTAPDVSEFKSYVDEKAKQIEISTRLFSPYRDLSVMEILITATVGGTVTFVFDILKDYIKNKFLTSKQKPTDASIGIKVGNVIVMIPKDTDPNQLDEILKTVIDTAKSASH